MENDTTPKRPGKARRILRGLFLTAKWLFVLLLAMLLIAGLIFKAPWKVNTLLAILIITPTIIPRRIRKYIYLTFALVLVALTIWIFLPEDDEGWEPYVFKNELAALEAKRHVPDEANAALVYNRLLDNYDFDGFDYSMSDCLPEDASDYARHMFELQAIGGPEADVEETIQTLLEAAQFEKCRFEVAYSSFVMDNQFERGRALKLWARLLASSAEEDVLCAQVDEGLAKYEAMLQMANHTYQQATTLDFLTAAAIEDMAIDGLNKIVISGRLVEGQLLPIEKKLTSGGFNWQSDWPSVLDHEKLSTKNTAAFPYEMHQHGDIRGVRNLSASLHFADLPDEEIPCRALRKTVSVFLWFFWPRPGEIDKAVNEAFAPYYAMGDPNYLWPAEPPESKTELSMSPLAYIKPSPSHFYSLHDIYARMLCRRYAARILIRLQRYYRINARYPETLEKMQDNASNDIFIDPTNAGPFVYRPGDDGFRLYSKGKNGVDDGGVRDRDIGADDILIWPVGD